MNGQDIKDYITLIGTDQKVEFTTAASHRQGFTDLWLEGTIKGINFLTSSILIERDDHSSFWQPLFYQLSSHHPKHFKVRLKRDYNVLVLDGHRRRSTDHNVDQKILPHAKTAEEDSFKSRQEVWVRFLKNKEKNHINWDSAIAEIESLSRSSKNDFVLSPDRLKEIEDSIDDTAGFIIKSSSLKQIIEEEVNRDRNKCKHEFMGGSCCIHCGKPS
jgi:hypothetical protein